mmetsp:Transcript_15449/g.13193  ORF Transcript_15449/g.13193 Transcript_15449/m.13193 type:complete len:106 (+) Transcript_15449:723-1040(+)
MESVAFNSSFRESAALCNFLENDNLELRDNFAQNNQQNHILVQGESTDEVNCTMDNSLSYSIDETNPLDTTANMVPDTNILNPNVSISNTFPNGITKINNSSEKK